MPDFRATIRPDGVVRLVDWHRGLVTWGPLASLLDARGRAGVTIADLTVERELDEEGDPSGDAREVIVTFLTEPTPPAVRALKDWAALVGYERIWLPGDVSDLQPTGGGAVSTRCSGCRNPLSERHEDFWNHVRQWGHFPMSCPLCGADIPQWTSAPRPARRQTGTAVAMRSLPAARS